LISMLFTAVFKGASHDIAVSEHATLGDVGTAVSDAFQLDASTLKLLSSRGALVPNAASGLPLTSTCEWAALVPVQSPPPTPTLGKTSLSAFARPCPSLMLTRRA